MKGLGDTMKADFGLAWDHGRRRALLAISAGMVALALALASMGGSVATQEARDLGTVNGKASVTVLEQPTYDRLGLSWG